jgi:hypothetical protein
LSRLTVARTRSATKKLFQIKLLLERAHKITRIIRLGAAMRRFACLSASHPSP